jgi:cytochrome P450
MTLPTTPLATDIVVDVPLSVIEDDPYPLYKRMRRESPIAWVPQTGRLWVTTWDLCTEAGDNDEVFGATQDAFNTVYGRPNVMSLSGESHDAARGPLDATFRPRAVTERVDTLIRPVVVKCVERIRERGRADANSEILEPLSVRAVGDMLGMTDVDDETLTRWFYAYGAYLVDLGRDPAVAVHAQVVKQELREYLEAATHRFDSGHDGSTLAHMFLDGMPAGQLRSIDEIIGTVGVMIVGGFQEPAHGAANALLGLLGRPEQAARVAAAPGEWAARAVQEGLRWIAPFNMTEKLTTADVTLGGTLIPAGTEIALVLGSANRDETRFEDPDTYDLDRPRKSHASFGYGMHFCVGHFIARQLGQIALEEMFARLPNLRLDPEEEPVVHGWAVRAAKRLPVVWDA